MSKPETPLMAQYNTIKLKYPDVLLLFRVGDFYETFGDDAKLCSKVLGITLTKRSSGYMDELPLAGFPYHSVDTYLPRLVAAGLRVAICEQMEDPKLTKKLVKRDVVEIITPGVTFNDKLLDHKTNNYLASWILDGDQSGFSFIDASTGEFYTVQTSTDKIRDVLEMIQPKEVLVSKRQKSEFKLLSKVVMTEREDWIFTFDQGKDVLLRHFKTHSIKSFGIEELPLAVVAAGAVLNYLYDTQRENLSHIRKLSLYQSEDFIVLDQSTKRNLELISSINEGQKSGTLLSILDQTQTAMGGRLLKKWIYQPLKKVDMIQARLDAVEELSVNMILNNSLRQELSNSIDLERMVAKVSLGKILPRELISLKNTLREIPVIKFSLKNVLTDQLKMIHQNLDEIPELIEEIDRTIVDEPPISIGEGGLIKPGYNPELDELRDLTTNGKDWMSKLQASERERTGISNLKINFNNVFGYYIEITKSHLTKIPENYIRKQTLVNAERFITPELKEKEEKLLHAEEKMIALEQEIFNGLRQKINEYQVRLQQNSYSLAELDCLTNYAHISRQYNYVKPVINDLDIIEIKDGRHPVIERLLPPGEDYIPNDLYLSSSTDQILIITGPNMSGKSSFLRQAGLLTLMAQIGCFVPAAFAKIGIVDRIFTRVGASDNLAAGESTFLVEMNEAANILNNATSKSLILLDEIGRGTSTFDGLSIAWSLAEYIHQHPDLRAKTLFATHYHELNELEKTFPRIKNYNVEVKEYGDKVIFLRKIIPGGADHSYGIQVAQMAGLPNELIFRAKEILAQLENENPLQTPNSTKNPVPDDGIQMTMFEIQEAPIIQSLLKLDINRLAPVEALLKLQELTSMARAAMKKK